MDDAIEARITEWRSAVERGRVVDTGDADELEGHLREQIGELRSAGLADDEAFLIAVKRLGEIDRITAELAREHSDRLWKQLAVPRVDDSSVGPRPFLIMLGFAALAAVLVLVGRQLGGDPGSGDGWFMRDATLFVLPVLGAYFILVRRMRLGRVLGVAVVAVGLAVAVNLFPYGDESASEILVAIHLPVALWFLVGFAYLGGDVRTSGRRMDFVRFTGEWAIYYALIALGGGVLIGLSIAVLTPIAPESVDLVSTWIVPSGAAGAVVVAAWLVEAKKSVIENLAPVLTAIFTPLFAAMLLVAATAYVVTGVGPDPETGAFTLFAHEFDRNLLTVFDILLLVVLGLVVYGISARESGRAAGTMDVIRLVAVAAAIVLDVIVVVSMLARVGEFGFTVNRVAALGLNVLLLVNLAGTVWHVGRLLAGREPAARLERWQTGYLAVFAGWVLVVLVALPPIFGFA